MRLTNQMRDAVIEAIRVQTIDKRHAKLKIKLSKLAQSEAEKLYPPKVKEWFEAMPKTETPLLHTISSVTVTDCSDSLRNHYMTLKGYNTYRRRESISLSKPVLGGVSTIYGVDIKLGKRGGALQEEFDQLRDDFISLKKTLNEALHSCTTDNQLRERFPDLAKHLPKQESQTKTLTITTEKVKGAIKCAETGECDK